MTRESNAIRILRPFQRVFHDIELRVSQPTQRIPNGRGRRIPGQKVRTGGHAQRIMELVDCIKLIANHPSRPGPITSACGVKFPNRILFFKQPGDSWVGCGQAHFPTEMPSTRAASTPRLPNTAAPGIPTVLNPMIGTTSYKLAWGVAFNLGLQEWLAGASSPSVGRY
ncbi:hypothetical protein BJV78DRAFT_1210994 [Lactifluus subvellereus]|nr:hypothetical protein BJV78DRAFT_1210994 [Lactifluus subvellereus]